MVEYSDPLHTCLLHDSLRPAVLEGRESVYFPETESFVRIFQAGGGRFGRISVAPCFADQPPGDLDSRSEVRFERNPVEAGKAKELSVRFPFDGICSVTEIGEFVPDAEEKSGRFLGGQRFYEIFHDFRVGVHFGEREQVAILPVAQDQPGRFDVSGCHRAMDLRSVIGPSYAFSRRRYGRRLFLPVFCR